MQTVQTETAMRIARREGVLRPKRLAREGIAPIVIARLVERGLLSRLGRGLYVPTDAEVSEHLGLALAARRAPQGLICLLSALRYHDLTTQAPFEVWLAVDVKAREPRLDYPPLRVVRFSGPALTYGVQTVRIDGVSVRITDPAKTVADCFKYRNKLGLDVAIEALRDYLDDRRGSVDEIWRAAEVCRMTRVMRPYLEMYA